MARGFVQRPLITTVTCRAKARKVTTILLFRHKRGLLLPTDESFRNRPCSGADFHPGETEISISSAAMNPKRRTWDVRKARRRTMRKYATPKWPREEKTTLLLLYRRKSSENILLERYAITG